MNISILVQVFMWIAVFTQFFLLAPDVYQVFKTRNTLDQKKWKFGVWIICSVAWIIYAILLANSTPIYEVIGLAISEGINVLCIVYIMIVKLANIHYAKELHLSEKEWYILYLKEKERKKRLRKLYGTSTPSDVDDIKGDREEIIKMIRRLWKNPKFNPIIDKNIVRSRIYKERVAGEYKNPNARLQHFIDAATVAELAGFYSLIVQDMAGRELIITVAGHKPEPKPTAAPKVTTGIN